MFLMHMCVIAPGPGSSCLLQKTSGANHFGQVIEAGRISSEWPAFAQSVVETTITIVVCLIVEL